MPRRKIVGSYTGSRKRARTEWRGADDFNVQAVDLTAYVIADTALVGTMTAPTLTTIRGNLTFETVLSSTNSGGRYYVGIIVVPGYMTAPVGPNPRLNADRSWMWYHAGIVQGPSVVSGGYRTIERVMVHVKVQRILKETDEVLLMVENLGPTSLDVNVGLRMLFSEGS